MAKAFALTDGSRPEVDPVVYTEALADEPVPVTEIP